LACLSVAAHAQPAPTDDDLRQAKKELRQTRHQVRERTRKIRTLQRRMNRLATRIARTEARVIETERHLDRLERELAEQRAQAALLQSKLDERSREAYMFGSAPVLYVLTATSAADAAARMSFLNEMNRRDGVLAVKVREVTERLGRIQGEVVRGRQMLGLLQRRIEADRRELGRKMHEARRLVADLHTRIDEIRGEISLIRPFGVCPVDGPHAVADGFGILHHHPKKEGGTHVHQGNDISAPMGTPIVAPFDGVATTSDSEMGGNGVYVDGEYGFVYNAHLSRFGVLGPVEKGDVVGYVGETGNATGPHVHFEWHPEGGPAVDPYDFLMLVC
ncbi:MAG TPA: peptidoglycan DD-metalloendopeptidase family protein, partial [Actinomycetota bacterium]|nr:peptidoglycan DD-metalloendopeptidase family protein [Actinomycetota bacterium]